MMMMVERVPLSFLFCVAVVTPLHYEDVLIKKVQQILIKKVQQIHEILCLNDLGL